MPSEPIQPDAPIVSPRASLRFLQITAGAMALSLLLTIVALAWPLPPVCTANETPNPAWDSAVGVPSTIALIGWFGAVLGGILCFCGFLGADGRRLAFLGLGVLAIGLNIVTFLVASLIGVPCHAFY